jgi:hypothetical protein
MRRFPRFKAPKVGRTKLDGSCAPGRDPVCRDALALRMGVLED